MTTTTKEMSWIGSNGPLSPEMVFKNAILKFSFLIKVDKLLVQNLPSNFSTSMSTHYIYILLVLLLFVCCWDFLVIIFFLEFRLILNWLLFLNYFQFRCRFERLDEWKQTYFANRTACLSQSTVTHATSKRTAKQFATNSADIELHSCCWMNYINWEKG